VIKLILLALALCVFFGYFAPDMVPSIDTAEACLKMYENTTACLEVTP